MTMKKVIRTVAFILAYALVVLGFEYCWDRFYLRFYLSSITEILALIAANVAFLVVFLLSRHQTREQRLAEEANRYLARRTRERATPITPSWRRIRRQLLWAPCVLAAVTSMFVPEAVGIASHMFSSRAVVVNKYRLKTPLTWIISYQQGDYLYGITAPGLVRIGPRRYWRNEVPSSGIVVYPVRHPETELSKNVLLDDASILAKHSFRLGEESLTCWDLSHHNRFVGASPFDLSIADVVCTSDSKRFYAHFGGWRGDSPDFYKMLRNIELLE